MDSDGKSRPAKDVREAGEGLKSTPNLALLYEGVFTVIVRMQANRQKPSTPETFRGRVKSALADVERKAASAGYRPQDVKDTHFAVVAFLDSVVLNSNDPIRPEWVRLPLQGELFGKADAGVVFFDNLEQFRSREDSEQLADVLEVYLLCLLLGFEGRYSGKLGGELDGLIEKLRRRVGSIRHTNNQISPSGALPLMSAPPASQFVPQTNLFRLVSLAAVTIAGLLFLLFKLSLIWASSQLG